MRRVDTDGRVFRTRRGKEVEIPQKWVGKAPTKRTIRSRRSRALAKYRKGIKYFTRYSISQRREAVTKRELLQDV